MLNSSGCRIVRYTDVSWEERERLPGWTNRIGAYHIDGELAIRLIDQPVGAHEPRHTHPGVHGTTIIEGRAIIDGVTLRPCDVLLGPSNEPHGPLEYPDGCKLLSCFQGSHDHSEATALSGGKQYRLIQSAELPWETSGADGTQMKTLLDRGAGRLRLSLLRMPGGTLPAPHPVTGLQARFILEGSVVFDGQTLAPWDLLCAPAGTALGPLSSPQGATLLVIEMR
jgi:hypothetical protein